MRYYLVTLALLAFAVILSAAVGAVTIPPGEILRLLAARLAGAPLSPGSLPAHEVILFQIRLPHTALIALAGAALGGSGAAYQGLFRNPLADPYVIGVSAGAGLGAVAGMTLGWTGTALGMFAVPAAAFAGALLTVAVVYTLAYRSGAASNTTLILAGVAVGAFTAALTSFLMLRSQGGLHRAMAWLLGGATMSGWPPVLAALPYVLVGLLALVISGQALNLLQFGEDQAHSLGLAVGRTKVLIIAAASLATAGAIAFAGIIGFIGLIVPHAVRLLVGPDYRRLIVLATLGGAATLLLADTLARTIIAPQDLPVGIVTALAGGPFFLWVLRRTTADR